MTLIVRTERDLEALNKKLTVELDEKRTVSDQLHCRQTELDQLKSELAKVDHHSNSHNNNDAVITTEFTWFI